MLQGTAPEHFLYIYAYLQYFSVIFNTKHSMPFVKKLITTLFINPCVHAIKHDLYSLIVRAKDAAKRHKCQVKITFSHVCYIWLFRRSRVLILRQTFSSRLHLRRSFLWKNSFCIISLAFVCKLVRWGGALRMRRGIGLVSFSSSSLSADLPEWWRAPLKRPEWLPSMLYAC